MKHRFDILWQVLLLAILGCLIASVCHAELIPPGCYVETGHTECYESNYEVMGFYSRAYLSDDESVFYYGQVVSSLLGAFLDQRDEIFYQQREC